MLVCTNDLWSSRRTRAHTHTRPAGWKHSDDITHHHDRKHTSSFSLNITFEFLAHRLATDITHQICSEEEAILFPRSALKRRPFYLQDSLCRGRHFISKSCNILFLFFYFPCSRHTTSGVFTPRPRKQPLYEAAVPITKRKTNRRTKAKEVRKS